MGEANDGLEAVQKAYELQPDLIVLDIVLPLLYGIEAARRICQSVPEAKILFLSANNDVDLVKEALSAGAKGFVLKADAESELLPAIEAIFRAKKFVSMRLNLCPSLLL